MLSYLEDKKYKKRAAEFEEHQYNLDGMSQLLLTKENMTI